MPLAAVSCVCFLPQLVCLCKTGDKKKVALTCWSQVRVLIPAGGPHLVKSQHLGRQGGLVIIAVQTLLKIARKNQCQTILLPVTR